MKWISRFVSAIYKLVSRFWLFKKSHKHTLSSSKLGQELPETEQNELNENISVTDSTKDKFQYKENFTTESHNKPTLVDESSISDPWTADEESSNCPTRTDEQAEHRESNTSTSNETNLGTAKTPQVKPRNIKGRRNRKITGSNHRTRPTRFQRPELICRRDTTSLHWEVVLLAEEECQLVSVHLGDTSLELTPSECKVPRFEGCLNITCKNGQKLNITLFDGEPLIFKLRENWEGLGRKISSITCGHFILIAPNAWKRAGLVPVEPDACTDSVFRAHYFHRDSTESSDYEDGFSDWTTSKKNTKIELAGQQVYDDSNHGILFVGDAPTLNSCPMISYARVGEEATGDWGRNFVPDEESLSDVLAGREGHFYLRIYDKEVNLLDSAVFRFHNNLKKIHLNGVEYAPNTTVLPSSTGYRKTEIRLIIGEENSVQAELPRDTMLTKISSSVIEVPPHPKSDDVSFTIPTDEREVQIAIKLPRIWWCLQNDNSECSEEWLDVPLVMTREEFRNCAISKAYVSLLTKRSRFVKAGFEGEVDQLYRRTIREKCIEIPLANFVDCVQIDQSQYTDSYFSVEWANRIVPVIIISADPMPAIMSFSASPARIFDGQEVTLSWSTRHTDDTKVTISPDVGLVESDGCLKVYPTSAIQYTLTLHVSESNEICTSVRVTVSSSQAYSMKHTAWVMCTGRRWRKGCGFSIGELRQAGFVDRISVNRLISIDRRRRTVHPINVELLKSVLNG